MTPYVVTCRPAWPENVPAGYTALRPSPHPQAGCYGEVDYPEALPRERADHFSLVPVGPSLPRIRYDGEEYRLEAILGTVADAHSYDFHCGTVDRAALEAFIAERAADHGVELEVLWSDA